MAFLDDCTEFMDGEAEGATARRGLRMERVYPWLAIAVLVAMWEAAVVGFGIPAYLIPAPHQVGVTLWSKFGLLMSHTWATIAEIVIGFVVSAVVGVGGGIIMVASRPFERLAYPLLVLSQTVPKIIVAPLFIAWFGFGLLPKVVIAALIAFFPIILSTIAGLKAIDPEVVLLARSMRGTPVQIFAKIRLPNALPSIFSGLKIGATLAVVGAIVGEFIGADQGLGYLMMVANGYLDMPLLFAAIVLLSVLGVIFFYLIDLIETLTIGWHVSKRSEVQGWGA